MSMVTVMLASMAGLMLTPVAAAEEGVVETRQAINYVSEQLLAEEGVERLRLQIARTAHAVCHEDGSVFTRFSQQTRECVQDAYEDGMAQLQVKIAEARSMGRTYAQASEQDEESAY